ncbi:hypothetical protein [Campylobacter concisus]
MASSDIFDDSKKQEMMQALDDFANQVKNIEALPINPANIEETEALLKLLGLHIAAAGVEIGCDINYAKFYEWYDKNIQIHINPKGEEMKPILVYDKLLFDYKEIKVNIPASEIRVIIDRFPLLENERHKEYSIAVCFWDALGRKIEDFRFRYEKLKTNGDLSKQLTMELLEFFVLEDKKADYILLQDDNEKILEIFCNVLKNIEP